MKKNIFFAVLACCTANALFSQINDAQVWENIVLERNFSPKFIARLVQEGRITENFTRPSYNYFDIGASYKISKHIHATLAYVWAEKKKTDDIWSPRQQAYADLTFRKKLKDFLVNDRQMILWQENGFDVNSEGTDPEYYLRNKLTIRYDRYFKYAPYIASELYYKMNEPELIRYRFDRVRVFAGLFYRLDKYNEFEVYYLLEKHLNTSNPQTNWVIGLGYDHSFK